MKEPYTEREHIEMRIRAAAKGNEKHTLRNEISERGWDVVSYWHELWSTLGKKKSDVKKTWGQDSARCWRLGIQGGGRKKALLGGVDQLSDYLTLTYAATCGGKVNLLCFLSDCEKDTLSRIVKGCWG